MNGALIGLGMVADTHVAASEASQKVRLCGVLGRDPAKSKAFAARHQIAKVYDNLTAVLRDPECDFIVLATPPDARLDYVSACVAAGKPILMEKPIERSFEAARQIVNICQEASVPLGIVFQHRARAASQALKTALEENRLGQICSADIRIPWWRDQSYYDAPGRGTYARDGGGVLLTQAIHTLDLALWFLGPVARVQAMLRTTPLHQLEAEDWAGGLLEFASGAVATLMATTAAYPGAGETVTLHGTKGSAHLEAGILTLHFQDGTHDHIGAEASTGSGADPMAFPFGWHQTILETFAASLQSDTPSLATGMDALRCHALIDALEAANRSGQITKVQQI
ncbi:MAG: Gfo/Idh/MocA family protein [Paracoccaceae bacterium]